jgi:hypothetical protein
MDAMNHVGKRLVLSTVMATSALMLSSCSQYEEYDPECVEMALDSYGDYQQAFQYTGEGVDASESDYVYDLCGDTTNPNSKE